MRWSLLAVLVVVCVRTAGGELERNFTAHLNKWQKNPPQARISVKMSKADIQRRRDGHIAALKKFAPYILDEYAAVDRIMKWRSGTCMDIQIFGTVKPAAHECTSWVLMPELTGGRSLLLHKNRDSSSSNIVAQQRAVSGRKRWVGIGDFGALGTNMGINEKALAVVMNNADKTNENSDAGLGTTFIARILLENCSNADEAVKLLEKIIAEKAYTHGKNGSIWFIADPGNVWLVENNAEHIVAKPIYSGMAIRANAWDYPEILPYSMFKPSEISENNQREYAVRHFLFNLNDVLHRGASVELMAEASRIRKIKDAPESYPLCGPLTNSAATFVIDQEFPEVLSYIVCAFGPPDHTLYLPVPLMLTGVPEQLADGTNPDKAFKRFAKKMPWKSDDEVRVCEAKLNSRYRKALADARRIMRRSKNRAQAAAVLNTAFRENCKEYLSATE